MIKGVKVQGSNPSKEKNTNILVTYIIKKRTLGVEWVLKKIKISKYLKKIILSSFNTYFNDIYFSFLKYSEPLLVRQIM